MTPAFLTYAGFGKGITKAGLCCYFSSGAKLSRPATLAVVLLASQNDMSGAAERDPATDPPHCARISTPLNRVVARSVKSTACPGLGTVKVAVAGLNVPIVNAGMFTLAFVALTSENDCSPVPPSTGSTVTEPPPP